MTDHSTLRPLIRGMVAGAVATVTMTGRAVRVGVPRDSVDASTPPVARR
jgi:hypothetical protein